MNLFLRITQSPISKNIIANLFKILVVFINQILLIPLYLNYWEVDMYADWIVLTAITGFFTMSDAGLNTATNNQFCIRMSQGCKDECNSLIINNFVIVMTIFITAISIATFLILFVDLKEILSIKSFSSQEVYILVIILVSQVFVQMLSTILNAIYNASHLASRATYLDNFARLGNAIAIFIGIVCQLSVCIIAFCGIIPYIICLLFKFIDSRRIFSVRFSRNSFSYPLLKKIVIPSVSYLSFPIGNAFIFQCFTVIVNNYFGATVLVCFNTSRTMANFVRSIVQAIAHAVKPEFSIMFGLGNKEHLKRLLKRCIVMCLIVALFSALFIESFGEPIYNAWTAGKVLFNRCLISILLFATIVNALWESSSVAMTATNNYTRLGLIYIVSTVLSTLIAYVGCNWNMSIYYVAFSLVIADLTMAIYSLPNSFKVLERKL